MKIIDILSGQWAITPEALQGVFDTIASHKEGPKIDLKAMEQAQIDYNLFINDSYEDENNRVAIVPIKGVLMKNPTVFERVILNAASMEGIKNEIQAAIEDPSVEMVVLDIDSPGGSVDGTKDLVEFIHGSRKEKKIIAFSDGMIASAAYWIASAAEEIFISNDTVNVGSIGVITTHVDASSYYEGQGIKITDIYAGKYKASGSENKSLDSESKEYIQSRVDKLYDIFVSDVAKNRGQSIDYVLENMADGRIFIGSDAISNNLVDGVSTLSNLIGEKTRMKTIEEFKAHEFASEFKAEIEKEMAVSFEAKLAEAKEQALEEERARISALQDLSMPGYEHIVEQGIKDGASVAGVSIEIINAQKQDLKIKAEEIDSDGPEILPEIEPIVKIEEKGFLDLINDYAKENNVSKTEARKAVIQSNPEAYNKFIGGLK